VRGPTGERVWPGYTRDYLRVLLPWNDESDSYQNQLITVRAQRIVEDPQNHDFAYEVVEMRQD
jgi:hypothetical protein